MSKSQGNVIDPQDVVKRYGADVLRLWVASTDFRNDMAASEKILKQVQEAYSKIRNTCRFLLSNLNDFGLEPETESLGSNQKRNREFYSQVPFDNLLEIDRWIMLRLHRLIERVNKAYDEFELHLVYHSLYDFCVNDLSAFYLDMSKDRLYCGGKDSPERRSAQFAMRETLNSLVGLMAPVLSFTAEDIYRYVNSKPESLFSKQSQDSNVQNSKSVFLQDMPKAEKRWLDEKLETKWATLFSFREKAYRQIEELRGAKTIGGSIDAQVEILAKGKELEVLRSVESLLPMVFIVSKVVLKEGDGDPVVSHAPGEKCQRCWLWSESVGQNPSHSTLCERCGKVVEILGGQ